MTADPSFVRDSLAVLLRNRRALANLQAQKAALLQEWEVTNMELLHDIWQKGVNIIGMEGSIRDAALAAFQATGDKHPFPGVEVKVFTTLTYDPRDALLWAEEHRVALQLDKRTFEGIARGPTGKSMEFLHTSEEPRAQIASDLSFMGTDSAPA